MFKKVTVVMLRTNQKAQDCLLLYNRRLNPLVSNKGYYTQDYLKEYNIQANHLYIVSDEEIKEGDWFLSPLYLNNGILQYTFKATAKGNLLKNLKKIIATTDLPLISDKFSSALPIYLPQPSQSFIDKYITEYNKGNIITDIMVEYEGYECENGHYMKENTRCVYPHCHKVCNIPQLKINPKDNTITIKRIKDSWTREEVKQLCWKAYTANMGAMNISAINETLIPPFNKWIDLHL